jgi:hypothetical protein
MFNGDGIVMNAVALRRLSTAVQSIEQANPEGPARVRRTNPAARLN